jgi:hypothetical protein
MRLQGKGCHPVTAGTTIASILLLCALVAAGVWAWLKQQQIVQREAFQALAARRGWSLTISEQKLGRPAILRLTARSGSGWHAESRLDAGDTHSFQTTVFVGEEPHWPDGCLVLTPDLQQPQGPVGRSQHSLETRVTLALPAGLMAQMRPFPAPPGLIVQATLDPVHRFDLEALAKVMADWDPQHHSSDGQPVILIGPEGLRVQVSHGMRRADQMEQFIDFALEVIRVI